MLSKCPYQSDLLETASNSSNDQPPKHPFMLEQSDHEVTIQLHGQKSSLLSPFSPINKTEGNASGRSAYMYFPESQPTSESTSLNSQPAFHVLNPAGVPNDPYRASNVYEYKGPEPRQPGLFSSLNSSASATDEHTSANERPLFKPQNLNVIFN
jgi:hypothetical protein